MSNVGRAWRRDQWRNHFRRPEKFGAPTDPPFWKHLWRSVQLFFGGSMLIGEEANETLPSIWRRAGIEALEAERDAELEAFKAEQRTTVTDGDLQSMSRERLIMRILDLETQLTNKQDELRRTSEDYLTVAHEAAQWKTGYEQLAELTGRQLDNVQKQALEEIDRLYAERVTARKWARIWKETARKEYSWRLELVELKGVFLRTISRRDAELKSARRWTMYWKTMAIDYRDRALGSEEIAQRHRLENARQREIISGFKGAVADLYKQASMMADKFNHIRAEADKWKRQATFWRDRWYNERRFGDGLLKKVDDLRERERLADNKAKNKKAIEAAVELSMYWLDKFHAVHMEARRWKQRYLDMRETAARRRRAMRHFMLMAGELLERYEPMLPPLPRGRYYIHGVTDIAMLPPEDMRQCLAELPQLCDQYRKVYDLLEAFGAAPQPQPYIIWSNDRQLLNTINVSDPNDSARGALSFMFTSNNPADPQRPPQEESA